MTEEPRNLWRSAMAHTAEETGSLMVGHVAPGGVSAPDATATMGSDDERPAVSTAKFSIGSFVEHREMGVLGVVFDVDPTFNQNDAALEQIPQNQRPRTDQPFYHVFINSAQNTPQVAYISEQSLQAASPSKDFSHPGVSSLFNQLKDGRLVPRRDVH